MKNKKNILIACITGLVIIVGVTLGFRLFSATGDSVKKVKTEKKPTELVVEESGKEKDSSEFRSRRDCTTLYRKRVNS